MPLPILISKQKNQRICPDEYKIGWLMKDEEKGYWMIWGSCRSKEIALKCAKDEIRIKGKRDVFISDEPLEKFLSLEQIKKLKKVGGNKDV